MNVDVCVWHHHPRHQHYGEHFHSRQMIKSEFHSRFFCQSCQQKIVWYEEEKLSVVVGKMSMEKISAFAHSIFPSPEGFWWKMIPIFLNERNTCYRITSLWYSVFVILKQNQITFHYINRSFPEIGPFITGRGRKINDVFLARLTTNPFLSNEVS